MRLFEVDQGSASNVMKVIQGLANKKGQPSELPWPDVKSILDSFGLGISKDGLQQFKNAVDPQGAVIQDVTDNGSIILNTRVKSPNAKPDAVSPNTRGGGGGGPSLDSMASHAAREVTR
jgi:hypothetical protein